MKRSSISSSSSPKNNCSSSHETLTESSPNDSDANTTNRTPPFRKMISLKSLMASIHCSPIKAKSDDSHLSNNCASSISSYGNYSVSHGIDSNINSEMLLTPPVLNDTTNRKLMPSPSKKITLRVKSSPKSSGKTTPRHDSKTPTCVRVDSCSSSDHGSSSLVDSPSAQVVANLPMEQVVGFFFLYENQELLNQAKYGQVIPLMKGKSLVSRKTTNDTIKNKKLPLFDHWICIDRPYISRVHALVEISDGEFVFIEDLSSSNSTHIVEKREKRKLNVHIKSNKLYQLRDYNYVLFGKSLCQYREKCGMAEGSITDAVQVYYNGLQSQEQLNTPNKQKKTPTIVTSRDESRYDRKGIISIPETPEFSRPSKLPSIRERCVPPTIYADKKSNIPVLAFETPKRIQESLKTQQENPILSIGQTPPSKCSEPSPSTSSGFETPSNTELSETPGNGSSNDKNRSPKTSDQLNLTDIDLSSLSLPDEIYEEYDDEEMKDESIIEDDFEDEILFSDTSGMFSEEVNEKKRSIEEDSSMSSKRKKQRIKKSEHQSPHILFTGIMPTDDNIKAIERLGGVLVEDPEAELLASRLTHLITDKIRRTVKFLCALGSCPNIVTVDWLEKSTKSKYFIDEEGYYLQDLEGEQKFNMSLIEVMNRRDRLPHKLFHKMSFFLTGSIQPRIEEMKLIIECNGGKTIPTINGLKSELGIHNRVFVITTDADVSFFLISDLVFIDELRGITVQRIFCRYFQILALKM